MLYASHNICGMLKMSNFLFIVFMRLCHIALGKGFLCECARALI